jgi:hypothetical protein
MNTKPIKMTAPSLNHRKEAFVVCQQIKQLTKLSLNLVLLNKNVNIINDES